MSSLSRSSSLTSAPPAPAAEIRQQQPHFDTVHAILRGHPDFEQWEEGQAVLPVDDDPMQGALDPPSSPRSLARSRLTLSPRTPADVQHAAPAAAPPPPAAPAQPAATPRAAALQRLAPLLPPPTPALAAAQADSPHVHAPVAGPAYPNPHLAHLYAAQPGPAPPQPQNEQEQGGAPSPRAQAAQAALKRARRASSPEGETPAQRRVRAGEDALVAFGFSPPGARAPLAPAPAPAPAPALAHAPVIAAAPPAAPIQDDHALSRCPKCDLAFVSADASTVEVHLRACLDAGGATVCECPVCGAGLDGLGDAEQAVHVGACCEGAMSGRGGGAREHVGALRFGSFSLSLSLAEGCRTLTRASARSVRQRRQDDAEGRQDARAARGASLPLLSLPSLSARRVLTLSQPIPTAPSSPHRARPPPARAQCIMCLDDFAPGERLARLSCYCVFHEPCIVEFWEQPGKFCPTHRERDGPTEVVMRGT